MSVALFNVLIVAASVAGGAVFLGIVQRTWPPHGRKESNDFTEAVVGVIGTTYAVILAFLLSGVWNALQSAQLNADQEANNAANIFRLTYELKESDRKQIQDQMRRYVHMVIEKDFPQMSDGQAPLDTHGVVEELWRSVNSLKPETPAETVIMSELLAQLRAMTEHRRVRILQSQSGLPAVMWAVLIAGGIITVSSACFFGVTNMRFHMMQVLVLSFLISLVLVTIADVDRPYQGGVVVEPIGFKLALRTVDGLPLGPEVLH